MLVLPWRRRSASGPLETRRDKGETARSGGGWTGETRTRYMEICAAHLGPIVEWLKENPEENRILFGGDSGKGLAGREERGRLLDEVVLELHRVKPGGRPGKIGHAKAGELARLLRGQAESLRARLNLAGAGLSELDGWRPLDHDPRKARRAGFAVWKDHVLGGLDIKATFPRLFAQGFEPAQLGTEYQALSQALARREFVRRSLGESFRAIARGGQFCWRRDFRFQNHQAWRSYQERFGRGDLMSAVLAVFQAWSARLAGLEYGGSEKDLAAPAGIAMPAQMPEFVESLGRASLDTLTQISQGAPRLRHRGRSPGQAWNDAFQSLLVGKSSAEQRELACLLDAFVDGALAGLLNGLGPCRSEPGLMSRLREMAHRLAFVSQWDDSLAAGTARLHAAYLALQASKPFGQLPRQLADSLGRHGLGAPEWELLRGACFRAPDGKAYLLPNGVTGELAGKLAAYLDEQTGHAPRQGRQRHWGLPEVEPGLAGPAGEVLRFLWQVQCLPPTYVDRVLGRGGPAFRDSAKDAAVLGDLSFLVALQTAFGYLGLLASARLADRQAPDPGNPAVWKAALLRGGAAGLYGDHVFGLYLGRDGGLRHALADAVESQPSQDEEELWREALRGGSGLGRSLLRAMERGPGLNLCYGKLSLDYLVLYHLQEMMSPGILRERERRMGQAIGQESLWTPMSPTILGDWL